MTTKTACSTRFLVGGKSTIRREGSGLDPHDDNGRFRDVAANMTKDVAQRNVENGIRKGALFQYVDSPGAYHCPGDLRTKRLSARERMALRQLFQGKWDERSGLAGSGEPGSVVDLNQPMSRSVTSTAHRRGWCSEEADPQVVIWEHG